MDGLGSTIRLALLHAKIAASSLLKMWLDFLLAP
jgi:hypothetical protein